mmetsp:Transcript_17225/g.15111  ORF Transcript_17225/g.15111 Transcript_17225/m.15111 type:complete len:221 (-) Transcript_17225:135-797(-)|eukprot:CAMPEP_0114576008 /NCGR_PEP_ID=MMETSP0125-20121206/814_1 /TAXON_ID=485358 ORGANISM="Aristerostoma sp., Strain ATCC 50986" /NCGR_SAMPLE_ID=MMETSP0125 /ASSEMBLY_ACC=CAM_ASM_000245 /LENGTH=220 /DNA_ID=CAMNT_0001764181 /DNA_START=46 /DNA_END=708 /DNA_ORIENTATION=+
MKAIIALFAIFAIATSQITGGWTSQSVTSLQSNPTFTKVIDQAIQQLQQPGAQLSSGDWSLKTIKSVQTQVVSGVNYKVDAVLENANGESQEWNLEIYYQPWTNTIQVSSANQVSGNDVEFGLLGGWQPITGDDATPDGNSQIQSSIDACLNQLESNKSLRGANFAYSSMISAQEQVVAGMNYSLKFKASNGSGEKTITCETYVGLGGAGVQVTKAEASN